LEDNVMAAPWPFQYAAKFVCGIAPETALVTPGTYATVVNVHNPSAEKSEYRVKFALTKEGEDGRITGFKTIKIVSDGAQHLSCKFVRNLADIPGTAFVDGFLVVESKNSLDVVAVYTTSAVDQKGVPAIAVERVFERKTG
jgi:hypothetical protein